MEPGSPWPYGLVWEASGPLFVAYLPLPPFLKDFFFEFCFLKPSIVYILSVIFCTYMGDNVVCVTLKELFNVSLCKLLFH